MSTELAVREQNAVAVDRMLAVFPSPDADSRRRFQAIALGLLGGNTELSRCSKPSVMMAVYQCAKLGLVPDKVLGHVYVIPFGTEATVIVGYKGYLELARRSGKIGTVRAACVYEGDEFLYDFGAGGYPRHIDARLLRKQRGEFVCAYAVAEDSAGGRPSVAIAWQEDIDRARKASRSGKTGPWETDFDAMACKTAVRRLAKMLPLSPELGRAMELEERSERGEVQRIGDEDFIIEEATAPKPGKSKFGFAAKAETQQPEEQTASAQATTTPAPETATQPAQGVDDAGPAPAAKADQDKALAQELDADALRGKIVEVWHRAAAGSLTLSQAEKDVRLFFRLSGKKAVDFDTATADVLRAAIEKIENGKVKLASYHQD